MKWFQEQFARSNIISGVLALGIWGAVIYLAIAQLQIPDILYFGGSAVVGFFFGTKQGVSEGIRLGSARRDRIDGGCDDGKL